MKLLTSSAGPRLRFKPRAVTRLLLLAGIAATLAWSLQADVVSQFNASADGWLSNGVCSFNPAEGNPAGDLDCGVRATGPVLTAPGEFLGNDLAAYDKAFSFDVFNSFSNVAVSLELTGGGLNLFYAFNAANNQPNLPPSNIWETESVTLQQGP